GCAVARRNRFPCFAYTGTHARQHFPLDSFGEQVGGRRYVVSRQHRANGSAWRRHEADPAVDSYQTVDAAGIRLGDPWAWRQYDDWSREGTESVFANLGIFRRWRFSLGLFPFQF